LQAQTTKLSEGVGQLAAKPGATIGVLHSSHVQTQTDQGVPWSLRLWF